MKTNADRGRVWKWVLSLIAPDWLLTWTIKTAINEFMYPQSLHLSIDSCQLWLSYKSHNLYWTTGEKTQLGPMMGHAMACKTCNIFMSNISTWGFNCIKLCGVYYGEHVIRGLSCVTFYMWNFTLTGKIYQQWILINNSGPKQ